MATGEAALCAVYPDARNPFAHPELLEEGLEEWKVREVWLSGTEHPDRVIDVTDTFDRKLAALREHVSQLPQPEALEDMLRGWLRLNAANAGMPEDRLAETFRVIPTA
jgi:LmbE family N-acetylglucosaminyl deacetylase